MARRARARRARFKQAALAGLALGTMLAFTCFGGAFDQVTAGTSGESAPGVYVASLVPGSGRMPAPVSLEQDPVEGSLRDRSTWQPDVGAARKYAGRREGLVSFTLLTRKKRWGSFPAVQAPAASTIKVILLVAYLNLEDVRTRDLDPNEAALLGDMIRFSDNEAADQVSASVGSEPVELVASRAGMRDFQYSPIWGLSRTTTRDYARLMLNLPGLVSKRHRKFALNELASISDDHRWGIADVVPAGWTAYFKGGWGISDGEYSGTVSHQIAMLSRDNRRIGIAIQTQDNPSVEYGNETIRAVAKRLLRGL